MNVIVNTGGERRVNAKHVTLKRSVFGIMIETRRESSVRPYFVIECHRIEICEG